jgi:hypothetical protein
VTFCTSPSSSSMQRPEGVSEPKSESLLQQLDPMRYPPGDLAILSAEKYDDGIQLSSRNARKPAAGAMTGEAQEGPVRKRRKASSPHGAPEEEEKKRSRGRPRLEPKDETAQDVSCVLCALAS